MGWRMSAACMLCGAAAGVAAAVWIAYKTEIGIAVIAGPVNAA